MVEDIFDYHMALFLQNEYQCLSKEYGLINEEIPFEKLCDAEKLVWKLVAKKLNFMIRNTNNRIKEVYNKE